MSKTIKGFSKLSKSAKIDWLATNFTHDPISFKETLSSYWNSDKVIQQLHDEFIENTISNYYLPYGIAPNFIINGEPLAIPMATEESSVVAAASLVAKFWSTRGGFKAKVLSTEKTGQIHFFYTGAFEDLQSYFESNKQRLLDSTNDLTHNMRKRGGGIQAIQLIDKTNELANYYQLHLSFETIDSMGANFINSCLERIASQFKKEDIEIVMSILSNYVPNCLVRAEVHCPIDELGKDGRAFAEKFNQAVQIAHIEPLRAVTHNKGIMNGIDAVVIATGNDFRAIEAGAHAYASKDGKYRSLTHCSIDDETFRFWIDVPLSLGTVGGLTTSHPLAKLSLKILQNPTAKKLMEIVAVAGLAQNFAAIKALITTGIQKGHMKMHLQNILNQLGATDVEKTQISNLFKETTISHSSVMTALKKLRSMS
ncbi:hydroxymethylglutaryl-CoA reductase, degradative [Flavobacteriaceae bacterium F08102]|nr:hydroxymethylglutaryl-CoA reductase, degradative [Flavobacteriaceae bacterium F08102]